ncbi:tetratricopeptide repeat protein [Paraglaciecola aquimarina]|uniref:Ancillary SecYEG translocon subunit n=1 Tax=Paraglaciecola algarum TaxID=3050085 RepID=A0ABS9D0W9_9ALTE|nr:tetratricopeptide repeat protein [Paraglaciecola sp. G1-23]MCF2946578.1 tetratricopeptide repeat protein [Paraglaciecola sp. G1-23]
MDQFETEEQQVEAIKRFWKENGTALIVGAVLGLGGLYGWRYFNESQMEAKEAASVAYEKASTQLAADEKGIGQAKAYIDTHADTGYSLLMALELAKKATDSDDLTEAAKHLEFVSNNADVLAIKSVAQVRLARIQIEQGELDKALATAEKIQDAAFKGASQEIKGDVYQAQKLFDKARAAYSAALEINERDPILKMKLDNLTAMANG